MIVKHCEKGWEIVSHYAHGLLAGKIACQFKLNLRPLYWVDFLTGIIEHDDHLLDFNEQNYLTENGTPKDFTMDSSSDSEAYEHAKRVYYNALQKSQMVALMVGRHLAFIYENLATDYEPMADLLRTIKKQSKLQRRLYGLKKTDENKLYDIMLFCDRLSLILCQDEIPAIERRLEINKTIGNKKYFIYKKDDDTIIIDPWPFDKNAFALEYEYRILTDATFKDNSILEQAIANAEISVHSCHFRK